MTSNLSKIKPKLRTQGRVSGNFGKNKVKAGSPMSDIGVTKTKVVRVVKQDDYLARLYSALDVTTDPKLKQFIQFEIKKILVQQNKWN
jgi:hypothetical protein